LPVGLHISNNVFLYASTSSGSFCGSSLFSAPARFFQGETAGPLRRAIDRMKISWIKDGDTLSLPVEYFSDRAYLPVEQLAAFPIRNCAGSRSPNKPA